MRYICRRESAKMLALYRHQCPLDPTVIFSAKECHDFIMEIEMHAVTSTDCCKHPSLKELVFKGALAGSTPLIVACHYGDFDAVERIIEGWEADVNKAAVYHADPVGWGNSIKLESATPLFVAASNGHAQIVRYLIEKGADISAKTRSVDQRKYYLTTLYGVVYKLRFGTSI